VIKLYGFPSSNYVNMVHLALLEKGIPFEYVMTFPEQSPEFLAKSPRGKLPCIETEHGYLNEASVILEYLEELGQGPRMLPADAYARARVRALIKEIELYIELPARTCFIEAFFGGTAPDAIKAMARDNLTAGFAALKRHGRFTPYVAGSEFTLADIVFLYSADVANAVARKLFGRDFLGENPEMVALLKRLGENPHVQQIAKAREAAHPAFIAGIRRKLGLDK
jgi:glutathione S-transferase